MVTFIVLMNVERGVVNDVAERLASEQEVSEVYSVSGNYDLVAIVRVRTNDDLAHFVTDKMATIEGIEHTEVLD